MERAESLGRASEEDRKKWKYAPEGEKLAVKYLKDECGLVTEIGSYDEEVRQHLVEGAQGVLVRAIDLPRNEIAKKMNKKAMEAIKELKRDKVSVENVYTKLRRIFNHYEQEGAQQRKQAYEAVKQNVEAQMQQAVQQQLGPFAKMKLNVENQPQFQQEWRRALVQLESQYIKLLDEFKQEILSVP